MLKTKKHKRHIRQTATLLNMAYFMSESRMRGEETYTEQEVHDAMRLAYAFCNAGRTAPNGVTYASLSSIETVWSNQEDIDVNYNLENHDFTSIRNNAGQQLYLHKEFGLLPYYVIQNMRRSAVGGFILFFKAIKDGADYDTAVSNGWNYQDMVGLQTAIQDTIQCIQHIDTKNAKDTQKLFKYKFDIIEDILTIKPNKEKVTFVLPKDCGNPTEITEQLLTKLLSGVKGN